MEDLEEKVLRLEKERAVMRQGLIALAGVIEGKPLSERTANQVKLAMKYAGVIKGET